METNYLHSHLLIDTVDVNTEEDEQPLDMNASTSNQNNEDVLERTPEVETRFHSSSRSRTTKSAIVLRFDDSYLKTADGILKLIQIIVTLASFICVISSGINEGGYLNLPLSWHLRIYIFASVFGFLMSIVIVFIHISSLIQSLIHLKLSLIEMVIYTLIAFLLLMGASLVASTVDNYQYMKDGHISQWTINQLLSAAVLGYGAMCLYGATAVLDFRKWQVSRRMDYSRYHLQTAQSDSTEALA